MFDIISIDWGSKRCGLAFGSSLTGLVVPYKQACLNADLLRIIDKEITARNTKKVILGIPTNFKGGDTQVTKTIRDFADTLKKELEDRGVELVLFDERGSTKEAKNYLSSKDKENINHLAAVKILQDYFKYGV